MKVLRSLMVLLLLAFTQGWQQVMKRPQRPLACAANHKGSEGVVHVGTTAIAELRGYEYSHANEPIDDTVLADSDRTFQPGLNNWSGSASAFWDETDTNGQEAIDVGSTVTLKFYPEGTGTSDVYHHGTAIVEGVTRRAAINGVVEADFSFRGTGPLAQTTV